MWPTSKQKILSLRKKKLSWSTKHSFISTAVFSHPLTQGIILFSKSSKEECRKAGDDDDVLCGVCWLNLKEWKEYWSFFSRNFSHHSVHSNHHPFSSPDILPILLRMILSPLFAVILFFCEICRNISGKDSRSRKWSTWKNWSTTQETVKDVVLKLLPLEVALVSDKLQARKTFIFSCDLKTNLALDSKS